MYLDSVLASHKCHQCSERERRSGEEKERAKLHPKSVSVKCMQLASPTNVFIYSISWDLRAVLITAVVIG
jgi:hypothetical protein